MSNSSIVQIIHVRDILPIPMLSSRGVIKYFDDAIKKIKHTDLIAFDFSDIEFISRSAAAELVSLKESYKNKKIVYFALNDYLSDILRSVAASKVYPKKENFKFNPNRAPLSDLLSGNC